MKKIILLFASLFVTFLSFGQCPSDPWAFSSHQDMVDFASLFPNCQNAYVFRFNGDGITDFSALSYVETVANVQFVDNGVLTSLEGFENEVLGMLWVENCDALVDFSGVNLFDSDLYYLLIKDSDGIASLNGLEALLTISNHVEITNNVNLPFCAIEPVCYAIANPAVGVVISGNAAGCESVSEVALACSLSVLETDQLKVVAVIPNPVADILQITNLGGLSLENVSIYGITGDLLQNTSETTINFSSFEAGIYFVEVTTNAGMLTKKIVKH